MLVTLQAETAGGATCTANELVTFVAGYPLPPIFPTLSPTASPTTVPTSAPTTCESGCNVQGSAVFDTCIVHDRDVANNLCYADYKDTRDNCVEGDVACSNTAYDIFERCCKREEMFFVDDCHACACNGICSGK